MTTVNIDINAESAIKAAEYALQGEQGIFLVTQKDPEKTELQIDDLYSTGTVVRVRQIVHLQQGVVRVNVEGRYRARLKALEEGELFPFSGVEDCVIEDDEVSSEEKEALKQSLWDAVGTYAVAMEKKQDDLRKRLKNISDPQKMAYTVAAELPIYYDKKQDILDQDTLPGLYESLELVLQSQINVQNIRKEFQRKVRKRIDKNQREYILREQLQVIRQELGEDNTVSDIDRWKQQTEELEADDETKEKIRREISRFQSLGPGSAESAVSRGYIETLLDLPWNRMSQDNPDLKNAKRILDRDHYGLEKVKERILEFLAVRALTDKGRTPIICLVGPPGTGKTSIARSVAEALEKKYIRISLGGVRDEAEIRGHRRTYVGAMPGRIVQGLRSAGVKNPLMLLDEIDKVSSDYKGDTASALLEVLDPDQNSRFYDHYVEIPVDLSEVLFIATANTTQTIPQPLLDRMEIIEISSYTENEKYHIAAEHLLDKQREINGLSAKQLRIGKRAMEKIISGYTREAGVRNLERKIGEICRKTARQVLEGETDSVRITSSNLEQYLGKEKYSYKKANRTDEIGIVRGLAWTSVGGVTLQIEVNVMPGKGQFRLTGQLGDVMKESAQTGISYIRSISERYGISKDFYQENDIHIHIPEGAVPKDGPSAGITMATAMLSAITGIPVRADVAMTGEITLRGRVLPIGGLKEKLLAAKTAGIKTVLVPKENRPDVEEISDEITGGLRIVFVDNMEQVLSEALKKQNQEKTAV